MESQPAKTQTVRHKVTWEEYQKDFEALVDLIEPYKFECIIPVIRGGLVIGTHLSNLLSIPLFFIISKNPQIQKNKSYLIVDDVSDSGQTLIGLSKRLKSYGVNFRVATLYRKDKTIFEPTYTTRTINDWIVFPWESSI